MLQLIKYRAEVNAQDDNGHTPLHVAAKNGRTEAIQGLLDHGADLDIKDSEGNTPLRIAANAMAEHSIYTLWTRGYELANEKQQS